MNNNQPASSKETNRIETPASRGRKIALKKRILEKKEVTARSPAHQHEQLQPRPGHSDCYCYSSAHYYAEPICGYSAEPDIWHL